MVRDELGLTRDQIGWCIIGSVTLTTLAAFLATDRTRWLGHAMVVIGLVSLVTLNLLAPAAFVAERNLARVIDPTLVPPDGEVSLDSDYLAVLPDDAIPALVSALPSMPGGVAARLLNQLILRKHELAREPSYASPFAWNLGRERARAALETLP